MGKKLTYEELEQKVRELEKDAIGRKRVETELREKSEKAQEYLDIAGVIIVVLNADQTVSFINKMGCEILGYEECDIVGRNWFDNFLPQKYRVKVKAGFAKLIAGDIKLIEYYENPILTKSGQARTISWHNSLLKNEEGKIIANLSSGQDITERKRTEEELRVSEEKFRNIFDNANMMIWGTYSDGNIRLFNKEAERIMGYSQEEALGMINMSLHPPEEREAILEEFKRHKEGVLKKNIELGVYTKDGKRLKVLLSQATFKDAEGEDFYVAMMQDITERKRAENALRESEERYRSLVGNINLGVSLMDADYNIVMVNEVIGRLFKKDTSEFVGKKCYRECEKREEICSHCPGKRSMATMLPQEVETEGILDDGSRFIARLRAFPTFGPNNEITGFIEAVEDITARRQAEEALKESEEKYQAQFDDSLDGIVIADAKSGIIIDCNPAMLKLVRREKSELIGKHQLILHPTEEKDGKFSRTFKQHLIKHRGLPLDTQIITKDGEKRDVSIKANMFTVRGKSYLWGIFHDITDRKRAEEDREKILHDMGERIKELTCMYGVAKSIRERDTLDKIFQDVINLIPTGWQYPKIICIKVRFKEKDHLSKNFKETKWKLTSDIMVNAKRLGVLEVYYTKRRPELDEGPFLKEERNLIQGITRALSEAIEHKQAEEELDRYRQHLEELVKERTAELTKANKQLKREIAERRRAEEDLRKERDKAQRYFDIVGVMLVAINTERVVTLINKKGSEILEYKESDIIGKNWFDNFLPKKIKNEAKGVFKKLIAGETKLVKYFENPVLTKSGEERIISWHNTVLKNEVGKILGTLSSGEDITEHKQVENIIHIQRDLGIDLSGIRNLKEAITLVVQKNTTFEGIDCGGIYLKDPVSGNFDLIYSKGLSKEFVEQASHYDKDSDRACFINEGESYYAKYSEWKVKKNKVLLREGVRAMGIIPIIHYNQVIGSMHVASRTLNSLPNTTRSALEAIASQIGSAITRLKVEEDLEKHRDQLEILIMERTAELKATQKELVRKERLVVLGQLTATVSHEIRNPLGTVRTAVFSIDNAIKKNQMDDVDFALKIAERNIIRCDQIIEELLDFSRIRELNLKPTNIDNWLKKTLLEQVIPDDIKFTYKLDSDIELPIDREHFRRVIINVLNNAIHAIQDEKSKGSRLRVETGAKKGRLEIHFIDAGSGISDDILERIFEPLFSTKNFGIGLGIPIVKDIMEQHKGGVEFQTKVGKGTSVTLWLPIDKTRGE